MQYSNIAVSFCYCSLPALLGEAERLLDRTKRELWQEGSASCLGDRFRGSWWKHSEDMRATGW